MSKSAKSAFGERKSSTNASQQSSRALLSRRQSTILGSKSVKATYLAPSLAHAKPTTPQPAPTSKTPRFETSCGRSASQCANRIAASHTVPPLDCVNVATRMLKTFASTAPSSSSSEASSSSPSTAPSATRTISSAQRLCPWAAASAIVACAASTSAATAQRSRTAHSAASRRRASSPRAASAFPRRNQLFFRQSPLPSSSSASAASTAAREDHPSASAHCARFASKAPRSPPAPQREMPCE
mmetsp:Transcript_28328/g.95374  ORF Transcript_28328/g.95374 Transcript_28328/m.95374 type:complete len:242 (-) Transcript_28328:322-1047(-)